MAKSRRQIPMPHKPARAEQALQDKLQGHGQAADAGETAEAMKPMLCTSH